MKKNIFFVHDVQELQLAAEFSRLQDLDLDFVTLSNDTYWFAKKKNIENIHIIYSEKITAFDNNFYTADTYARYLDFQESELRKKYFYFESESLGWNYLNYFFIIYGLLRISTTLVSSLNKLPFCEKIFVFDNGAESSYHFDSNKNRALTISQLTEKTDSVIVVSGPFSDQALFLKKYRKKITIPHNLNQFKVVTHAPTLFYEKEKFIEKFNLNKNNCIDIESLSWDVKLNSNRINLVDDPAFDERHQLNSKFFDDYEGILKTTFNYLSKLNNKHFLPDAEGLKSKLKFQLNFYKDIETSKIFDQADQLFVTEHDGGLTGPLIYSASRKNVRTHVLPHSTSQNIPFPYFKNITRYEIYGNSPFLTLGQSDNAAQNESKINTVFIPKDTQLKRIMFVFCEEDDCYRLASTNYSRLNVDLVSLTTELKKLGFEIGIRVKPNKPSSISLNDVVYCHGSQDYWINWPSICVSLIAPTHFLYNFQIRGVYCFHIQENSLNEFERGIQTNLNLINLNGKSFNELFKDLISLISKLYSN